MSTSPRSRTRLAMCFVGAVLALVTTACRRTEAARASDAAPEGAPVISLSRGPCRGTCPVYRVDLYENGAVRFDGAQHVARLGVQSGSVRSAEVRALLDAFAASTFGAADSAYVYGSASCGQYATDLPVMTLTARVQGRLKTVQRDPGCRGAPDFLRTLEARVDSVAGSARWIAGAGASDK